MTNKRKRREERLFKNLNVDREREADKFINNEAQKFIRLYVKNSWFRTHASTTMRNWRKNGKKEQYKAIKKICKGIPDYMNSFCNLIYVLRTYYPNIPREKELYIAETLFYRYEPIVIARLEYKFSNANDKDLAFHKKFNPTLSDKEVRLEQTCRGFVPIEDFETDPSSNYLVSVCRKLVYPRAFNAHVNSMDIEEPGIYIANQLYGFRSGVYIGSNQDYNNQYSSMRKFFTK